MVNGIADVSKAQLAAGLAPSRRDPDADSPTTAAAEWAAFPYAADALSDSLGRKRLPRNVDWHAAGLVGPVKNQARRGGRGGGLTAVARRP